MEKFTLLTRRQSQLVDCLSRGLSNKEIAKELNLSVNSVRVQLSRLYKKFNAGSRAKLLLVMEAQILANRKNIALSLLLRQLFNLVISIPNLNGQQKGKLDYLLMHFEKIAADKS